MADHEAPEDDASRDDAGSSGSRVGRLLRRVGRRLRAPTDKPVPSQPVAVVFEGRGEGELPGGISLLAGAAMLGVNLTHYCGGMCSCGTCRVEVVSGADNLSLPRGNETMVLGAERARAGDRLACQARVLGPVVVRVPDWF